MGMDHLTPALDRRMATVRAIASDHGTSPDLIMGRAGTRAVRTARQTAMLAMRETFDDGVNSIARMFGRSRRQVQYCLAAAAGWQRDDLDRMGIVEAVAEAHGLTAETVLHGGRRPHVLAARREAICAVADAFGDSPAGLAAALGIDQTTARLHLRARKIVEA